MQGKHLIQDRAWEKTGGWTRPERLRIAWYRLRLTVQEMNYATRRLAELQTGSPRLAGRPRLDDAGHDGLLTRCPGHQAGRRQGRRGGRRSRSRAGSLVEEPVDDLDNPSGRRGWD